MEAGEPLGNGYRIAVQRSGYRLRVPGLLRGSMQVEQNFKLLNRVDALKKKTADTLWNTGSHCGSFKNVLFRG